MDVTLIGLTGNAGAGKDTAAGHLVRHYGFVQASFADPIRDMALLFLEQLDIDHAFVTERDRKEMLLPGLPFSARALMQTLGTECGRALSPDLWVHHLARRMGLDRNPFSGPVHDRIVISDVRFPNEAAWLRARGGRLLRLYRPGQAEVRAHASEQHVHDLVVDIDIQNNATVWELHRALDTVMEELDIEHRPNVWGDE